MILPQVLLANLFFAGFAVLVGTLSSMKIHVPRLTHQVFYFLLFLGTLTGNFLYLFTATISPMAFLVLVLLILLPFFRKGGRVHSIFGWFSFFLCLFQFFLFKYHANQYLIR